MSDGPTGFAEGTDQALPQPWFCRTISGARHQFMQKGELKVRIPNPHKGGDIDWSLVKEILRQAGIKIRDWDQA